MGELVEAEHGDLGGVCSTRIIVLTVEGPNVPSADLIDMPGLVASPEALATSTRALVQGYIDKHGTNSLYLFVVPAGESPRNSIATELIEKNKLQSRAFGVFSMCDDIGARSFVRFKKRLAATTAGETEAQGGVFLEQHGWVATMNAPFDGERVDAGGSATRPLQQAHNEVEWFRSQGMGDMIGAGLASTNALVERLSGMFLVELLEMWAPTTLFRLAQEHARLNFKLACLGAPAVSGFVIVLLPESAALAIVLSVSWKHEFDETDAPPPGHITITGARRARRRRARGGTRCIDRGIQERSFGGDRCGRAACAQRRVAAARKLDREEQARSRRPRADG